VTTAVPGASTPTGSPGEPDPARPDPDRQREAFWREAVEPTRLPADHVHVWSVDLDADEPAARSLDALLDDEERARARRFVLRHHRKRFVVHRAALRTILGGYLAARPEDLRFAAGAHGKPALAGAAAASGLSFSVSHSDGLALIAVALRREVGIDVERVRFDIRVHDVARRHFTASAAQALASLPPPAQPHAFYLFWCAHEAYVKALGVGLSAGPGVFDDATLPADAMQALRAAGKTSASGRWTLSALDVGPRYVAILAVEGRRDQVAGFRWRPPGCSEGG
jgi:4'-phosphopantetheinyl transferase